MTPTARSLSTLRAMGYRAEVVERWVPRARIKRDVFGADVLAAHPVEGALLVQATTGANLAARCARAMDDPGVAAWLAAGARWEAWAWRLGGPRGKRKVWTLSRRRARLGLDGITFDDPAALGAGNDAPGSPRARAGEVVKAMGPP